MRERSDGVRLAASDGDGLVDSLIRWTLRAGAVALPLTVVAPAADPYILPKLLAARALLVVLLALHALRALRRGRLEIRRTPLDLALLVFVVSAALSTATAVNVNLALFGAYTRDEGLLTLCTYAGLFWITAQSLRDAAEARTLLVCIVAAGCVVAFFAALGAAIGTQNGDAAGAGESAFTFGGMMRARGGFGNPNVLAAFLAMLVPPVAELLLTARTTWHRVLAANALFLMVVALVLTFGRSAWVGAGIGMLPVLWRHHRALLVCTAAAAVSLLAAWHRSASGAATATAPPMLARLLSLLSPGAGSGGTRLHIWSEALLAMRGRIITGWGPDTFGLVYPRFQQGRWTPGFVIDKAHSDLLQIAATQGDLGVFAYLWVLFGALRAAWRGRAQPLGAALLGAVVAYQVTVQVNFSWFPSSGPYWLLLGACAVVWSGAAPRVVSLRLPRMQPLSQALLSGATCALACLALSGGVVRPAQADVAYGAAVQALESHRTAQALDDIRRARALAPWESRYAEVAGDLAAGMHGDDATAPAADWRAARDAYAAAAALGTSNADSWRHLAMADVHTGDLLAARDAARTAVALDRYDVRNGRLLTRLGG